MILLCCDDDFLFRCFNSFQMNQIQQQKWIKIKKWILFIQNRHFTHYLFTCLFQDKMKCRFFLNSIIWQCLSFFKLFSCKNQSLLIWWNSFFFLDFCFDCVNWIVWFNFESDCLTKICIFYFFIFNLKISIFKEMNFFRNTF